MESIKKIISKYRYQLKSVLTGAVSAAVMFFLLVSLFDTTKVMSSSMEPVLSAGDTAIFKKMYVYEPAFGDVVEFNFNGEMFCKRVIGLPGDDIAIKDGKVYVNDDPELDTYAHGSTEAGLTDRFHVPEGCLFMLGDNRENSYDSRYWDDPYVKIGDVRGILLRDVSR